MKREKHEKKPSLTFRNGEEARAYAAKWREEHGQDRHNLKGETLCWMCAKACTKGCSWSYDFTPVDGWEADETVQVHESRVDQSFMVFNCPEFVSDVKGFDTFPEPCPRCHRQPAMYRNGAYVYLVHNRSGCPNKVKTPYKKTAGEAIIAWNRGERREMKNGK